jgi:hypothetical protein
VASTLACWSVPVLGRQLARSPIDSSRSSIATMSVLRPEPDTWSVLEYGCHVRDVCRVMDGRLQLMLAENGAEFENWDQDATAIEDDYVSQDPATVANELATAASMVADRFDEVTGNQWSHRGVRSNGSVFTVASLGRYMAHDLVHHVWDVERGPRPQRFVTS